MSHFAGLVEKISEWEFRKASERDELAKLILPEMQKALDELKKRIGAFGIRILIDEFEEDEGYECDFQIKWALSEDWRRFDGDVPARFNPYLDDIYEMTDALDTLAPILKQKVSLKSETV